MKLDTTFRRENVLLVDVEANHVLIDHENEQVHVINEAAAWVWAQLGSDTTIGSQEEGIISYVAQLGQQGLLGENPTPDLKTGARFTEAPLLLDSAPLLVAAANCPSFSDPFFEG
ncbi:MAG: hypothetical protein ACI8W8_001517 [Rhodothermales bacterium]|jgi:hypothetical protein